MIHLFVLNEGEGWGWDSGKVQQRKGPKKITGPWPFSNRVWESRMVLSESWWPHGCCKENHLSSVPSFNPISCVSSTNLLGTHLIEYRSERCLCPTLPEGEGWLINAISWRPRVCLIDYSRVSRKILSSFNIWYAGGMILKKSTVKTITANPGKEPKERQGCRRLWRRINVRQLSYLLKRLRYMRSTGVLQWEEDYYWTSLTSHYEWNRA